MPKRLRVKDVQIEVEVLAERVDALKEDVQENSQQIQKLHGRINDLIENQLKHLRLSRAEKASIGMAIVFGILNIIIALFMLM